MKLDDAVKILKKHNDWRRGDESTDMQHPKEIGEAIDKLIESVESFVARERIYRTIADIDTVMASRANAEIRKIESENKRLVEIIHYVCRDLSKGDASAYQCYVDLNETILELYGEEIPLPNAKAQGMDADRDTINT